MGSCWLGFGFVLLFKVASSLTQRVQFSNSQLAGLAWVPVQSCVVTLTLLSLVLVPLLPASPGPRASVPSISVSLGSAAWLSWSSPQGHVCQPRCQLTPALPCTPALCHAGFLVPLPSCSVSRQRPVFPFSVCCSKRCIGVSPQLLLQKRRAPVPLCGSPHPSPALQQRWVLVRPFMWASLMSLNDIKWCQWNSFLRAEWLKWACGRRAGHMQEGRENNSAAGTREAAGAAQTPPPTTCLLGNVPLGVCSFRDPLDGAAAWERCGHLELLLPGFSTVPCRFKVKV